MSRASHVAGFLSAGLCACFVIRELSWLIARVGKLFFYLLSISTAGNLMIERGTNVTERFD